MMLAAAAVQIQVVEVPRPYYAVQIRVGRFPLPAETSTKVHVLVGKLVASVCSNGVESDTFLQDEFLANRKEEFTQHVAVWGAEAGLGVWPDRPPPELWKITDIFKAATGQKVPLAYRVYRTTKGPKVNSEAFDVMFGSGMVLVIAHSGPTQQLLKEYKDTFLPNIKQPNFRIFPFYVPLLDLSSLKHRNSEELAHWLGKARLYVRESPADDSILVISDTDLEKLLDASGSQKNGQGSWLF